MAGFERDSKDRGLIGGVLVSDVLSQADVTTPAYLYDVDGVTAEVKSLVDALGDPKHIAAYAIKANSAATIVRAAAAAGAGADLVSGGELEVALACGVPAARIVMSGVAKSSDEIDRAIASDILAVQVESVEEIPRLAARARAAGKVARLSLRVNPGIEIDSHEHIATGHDEAKFGITASDLPAAWDAASVPELSVTGVSTHVGSMLEDTGPYVESGRTVCKVAKARLASGASLEFVDFGGGFGIDYGGAPCKPPGDFARAALQLMKAEGLGDLRLVVEPGRAIVGPHGVLVATVLQTKQSGERRWLMIDAGMNDLLRPALYAARHRVEPVDRLPGELEWRVVGPVCESSDDFGSHALGEPPSQVVLRDAGAYGFAMASEYNGRSLPAEVFVSGGKVVSVQAAPGQAAWVKSRLGA